MYLISIFVTHVNMERVSFPFTLSSNKTCSLLQLVHVDLWGVAPLLSTEGCKYYINFLDDFTRFTWIYPLVAKSDTNYVVIRFQAFVEQLFGLKQKFSQFRFWW